MVDQIIRPADLPNRASPNASEKIPVDNGSNVAGATVESIVLAGRPTASQAEAEAGTDAVKAMTPLTTAQAIVAQGDARFATVAQGALADTAVQPSDLAAVATSGSYSDLTGAPPALTDGDKGDVTVSSAGADWTINPNSVYETNLSTNLTISLDRVVTSRAALAALGVTRWASARLNEGGRSGLFDLVLISSLPTVEQAKVAADNSAQQGVYVVSSDDNLYVWKRRYSGPLMAEWFGAVPWFVGDTHNSDAAFQAAATFAGIAGAWRWKGRHRLTSKITIPEHQVFGAYGNLTSIVPQIFATPATFIGVNTSVNADKIDNAVFFDALGVAFELGQAAEPQDFTIYGRGYIATDGTKNLNFPSSTTGDWYGQVAFRYAKYIKPTNVSVVAFQIAYDSVAIGVNSGNYYSSFNGCSAEACCTIFQVGSTPSYNTEIHGGRWTCGRFGQFDTSVRNFKMFGGSIEGFSAVTYFRDDSEVSFFGTYFETKNGGTLDQLFSTFHSRVIVNFIGCLVYMDNFKTLFGCATTSPSVLLNSHGNKFMVPEAANDTAASHIIYAMTSATVKAGSMFGDMIVKYSGSKTTTYVDGVTASYLPYSTATVITI